MSVLIKGMEMPKRCEKCRCCKTYEKGIYCTLTITPILGNGNARLDNCPLIEVPPHGRLIDADALISKIQYTDDFYETPFVDWDDILDAPTVIPADKDGET